MTTERTPLLWSLDHDHDGEAHHGIRTRHDVGDNVHTQFCTLIGCPPSNAPVGYKHQANSKLLYGRATSLLRSQGRAYAFTASLSNTLLLVQVVLGAALTGLGASGSPPWVVTVFGATNTIIAGLVAYLKSRGQPVRARMYRDDLERVVDEIENSEVMWLGISQGVHGYDEIDTDGEVTVRSEVARLTRLYDRAVRNNSMNNPEMYMSGQADGGSRAGLRNRDAAQITGPNISLPAVVPAASGDEAPAAPGPAPVAPAPVLADPDESPASARSKPKEAKKEDPPKTDGADDQKSESSSHPPAESADKGKSPDTTQPPAASQDDPDAAPASKPKFGRAVSGKSTEGPKKVEGDEDLLGS